MKNLSDIADEVPSNDKTPLSESYETEAILNPRTSNDLLTESDPELNTVNVYEPSGRSMSIVPLYDPLPA